MNILCFIGNIFCSCFQANSNKKKNNINKASFRTFEQSSRSKTQNKVGSRWKFIKSIYDKVSIAMGVKCYLLWHIMVLNSRGLMWSYVALYGLEWSFCCFSWPCVASIDFAWPCVTLCRLLWPFYGFYGRMSFFLAVKDPNSFSLVCFMITCVWTHWYPEFW